MISIDNYSNSNKSVDVNSLPQTLQEGHQFFIEAESVYDQDESKKETIDIYLQKLNEYLEAKDSKAEADSGPKEVNSKSTSPPKTKSRVKTTKPKTSQKSKVQGKKDALITKPAKPVTPYLKFSDTLFERLKSLSSKSVELIIVYGKTTHYCISKDICFLSIYQIINYSNLPYFKPFCWVATRYNLLRMHIQMATSITCGILLR